jgi:hypothetical protein
MPIEDDGVGVGGRRSHTRNVSQLKLTSWSTVMVLLTVTPAMQSGLAAIQSVAGDDLSGLVAAKVGDPIAHTQLLALAGRMPSLHADIECAEISIDCGARSLDALLRGTAVYTPPPPPPPPAQVRRAEVRGPTDTRRATSTRR